MDPPAPGLDQGPVRHADCCLSLSSKLFDTLVAIFTDSLPANHKRTILSIGSGTGLLEALLLRHIESKVQEAAETTLANLKVEGAEVLQPGSKVFLNKYLPEQANNSVRGTWALSSRMQDDDVSALMFVYPRQPALVAHYVKSAAEIEMGIKIMVWLGLVADWHEFESCFLLGGEGFKLQSKKQGIDVGLDDYEVLAVFIR